jgi:membrane protease YdiL (CAAX protease family)
MKPFFEVLILYWVIFLRISIGDVPPGEPAAFSIIGEITRMVLFTVPSLLLVWHLLLRTNSLKAWGITLPQKKDFAALSLAFPALLLIGMTISLVSQHFRVETAGPGIVFPETAASWVVLAFSCLLSAYLEESYFRFYVLSKRAELGIGPHRAVLVSMLLFAFCHAYEGPWGFLNAALSGVALAFLFLRFQSLHGIAVAHALYNISAYVLEALRATPVE